MPKTAADDVPAADFAAAVIAANGIPAADWMMASTKSGHILKNAKFWRAMMSVGSLNIKKHSETDA